MILALENWLRPGCIRSAVVGPRLRGLTALLFSVVSLAMFRVSAETRFVEYLQGDGNAYIDTGFTLDNTCRVELEFAYTSMSDSMIYGSRTGMNTTDAHISGLSAASDEIVTFFVNGTSGKRPCRVQNASRYLSTRLCIDNGVEGTLVRNLATGSVLAQSTTTVADVFTTPGNCLLFFASGSGWSQNKFSGRIYSFRVYRNHVLSADFRPCVKDGVAGMVDIKHGRAFHGNVSGTGAFTAGPDSADVPPDSDETIVPLAYIQGTGSGNTAGPWIATDFVPCPQTDKIIAVISFPTLNNDAHNIWCARGTTTTTDTYSFFELPSSNVLVFRPDYYNAVDYLTTFSPVTNVKYTATFDRNRFTLTDASGSVKLDKTYTNVAGFTRAGGPMALFCCYVLTSGGELGSLAGYSNHRLHSFAVYRNGTLIHNLVPCRQDGVVTLFDSAADKLKLTKKGVGAFVAGPNATGMRLDERGDLECLTTISVPPGVAYTVDGVAYSTSTQLWLSATAPVTLVPTVAEGERIFWSQCPAGVAPGDTSLVWTPFASSEVAFAVRTDVTIAGMDRPRLSVPLVASAGTPHDFKWIRKGTPDVVVAETAEYAPTSADLEHWLTAVASTNGVAVGEKSFYFSRLPVLYLNTENGKAITDKEHYVPATLRIQGNGQFAQQYDGATEVKGRGNSSWSGFAQKPYKLKLGKKTNLFGYGKNKHWVLISNFADNAFMRNRHGAELARELGVAGMDMTWVAVVLNGVYYGVEMLAEHVRVDANRVNVFDWESKAEDVADALYAAVGPSAGWTELDQAALEEQMSGNFSWISTGKVTYKGVGYRLADHGLAEDWNLTGGYLYEMEDRYDEPAKFLTALKKTMVQFSKPERAHTDASMFAAAQKVWNDFEASYLTVDHYSPDGQRPLADFADLDSMAGYWLTAECLGNVDCCAGHSRYSYVDVGGKLCFGPVWDFDYGGGSIAVQDRVYGDSKLPDHWVFNFRDDKDYVAARTGTCFFVEWLDDPHFVTKAYGLYWRKARPWLAAELAAGGGMDEKIEYLAEAGDAHDALYKTRYGRWGFNGANGDVAKYRAYLTTRLAWLDRQFASVDTLMAALVTTNNAASAHPYAKSSDLAFAVIGGFATNVVCGTDFAVETPGNAFTLSLTTTLAAATQADIYLNGVKYARIALTAGMGEVSVDTTGVAPVAADRHLVSVIARDGADNVVARSYATVLVLGRTTEFSGSYPNGMDVELTGPSSYTLRNATFGAPLVFSGPHPLVLELAENTQNTAPRISTAGSLTIVGAGALTLTGTNELIGADGDIVVSNGVVALDVAAAADGDAAVMMKGGYFQCGGSVTLAMTGDAKTYGLRWKDVKDVEAVIVGGSFTATVASGAGSAVFKANKGSNDFTLGGTARLTAHLAATDARVVDVAGKARFKDSAEARVTATGTATHARVFKSEKKVSVSDSAVVVAEVPTAGSEIVSSDSSIRVEGGVLALTAGDDCLSAQTDIVIADGMVQALSLEGDALDANGSVTISNGYVFATTCSPDHEGIDVDPSVADGLEHRLLVLGGSVVAAGGAGRLHAPDPGSVDCYTNACVGSLRKYLVLTSVHTDRLERLSVKLDGKRNADGFSLIASVPHRVGDFDDTAVKPSEDTPKGRKLHDRLDGVFVTKVAGGTTPGAEVELESVDAVSADLEAQAKEIVLSAADIEAGVELSHLRMEARPCTNDDSQVRYLAVVAVNPDVVAAPAVGEDIVSGTESVKVVGDGDGTSVEIGITNAVRGLWYGCETAGTLMDAFRNDVPSFRRADGRTVTVTGSRRSDATAFYRVKVVPARPVK